ncbi:MAG: hypothetical protein ACLSA2_02360 [Candidatus Gastranaerophilaceae bacterium]|nr:unknown [Clostridium sp. CAG:967]
MEENNTKPDIDDVTRALKKMLNLNSLFFDSVKYNKCECYDKYQYVSVEFDKLIWVILDYFQIELD